MTAIWIFLLVANLAWFGLAAWSFGLTPGSSAMLLVRKADRGSPMFFTLSESVRFFA
jgi:hypothetical protein